MSSRNRTWPTQVFPATLSPRVWRAGRPPARESAGGGGGQGAGEAQVASRADAVAGRATGRGRLAGPHTRHEKENLTERRQQPLPSRPIC